MRVRQKGLLEERHVGPARRFGRRGVVGHLDWAAFALVGEGVDDGVGGGVAVEAVAGALVSDAADQASAYSGGMRASSWPRPSGSS